MSINKLPDEIIQQVLYYVSPVDNLCNVQPLSCRFYELANSALLWKYLCRISFRFWSPKHGFLQKLRLDAHEVNWKQLFILRHGRNVKAFRQLDELIASKHQRFWKSEQICRLGYDVKDFLLEQCATDDLAEDVLARRYYSGAMLGSIHRAIAIEAWQTLRFSNDQSGPYSAGNDLERALGAFDMFVLYTQPGDLDDISRMLDEKTADFRASEPTFPELTTREKALSLNRWLCDNNLVGQADPEMTYRNLRNCLIGQALRHEDHESLPIISSAIYCCIAQRLGMAARCSAFPGHVLTVVYAAPGETLDNAPVLNLDSPPEAMYLDPYGSKELPLARLRSILQQLGQTSTGQALGPAPTVAVALRVVANIDESVDGPIREMRYGRGQSGQGDDRGQLSHGNNFANLEAAAYSAHWARLILSQPGSLDWELEMGNYFLNISKYSHPEDDWLMDEYVLGPHNSHIRHSANLQRSLNRFQQLREQHQALPADPQIRTKVINKYVSFRVGQLFRHTSFGYLGAIIGWEIRTPSQGIAGQSASTLRLVSVLPTKNSHVYYRCLNHTLTSVDVVHANNINIVQDVSLVKGHHFPHAGKYFKRFDRETCTFVSNMKEEYPDD